MSWLDRVRNALPFQDKRDTPDNLWTSCPSCKEMLFTKEYEENLSVCPRCEHHGRIGTRRLLHQTIDGVRHDMPMMSFNTAVAKLITLNNHVTKLAADRGAPRDVIEPMVLMLAPLAPHVAEELWSRLGHSESLTHEDFPVADPAWLTVDTAE